MTAITIDQVRQMHGAYVRRVLGGHLYRLTQCPRVQFVDQQHHDTDWDHRLWFVDGHQVGIGPSGLEAAVRDLEQPAVFADVEEDLLREFDTTWQAVDPYCVGIVECLVDKGALDIRRNVVNKHTDMDHSMNPVVWFVEARRRATP
jgi:hypothetical protein